MNFLTWNPDSVPDPADRIPVTLISGFLGAGKTTLINHLLRNPGDRKLAVVVNDLGSVNIDAALIRRELENEGGAACAMVELTSGCICCSITADLPIALFELVQQHRPDHILVEASGAAQPLGIAESLYGMNRYDRCATDFLRIANLVTVVDGPAFHSEWIRSRQPTSKRARILHNDPRRPLIELLIEQTETADLLLINKLDALSVEALHEVRLALEGLNHRADLAGIEQGRIDPSLVLDHERFSDLETPRGAAWRTVLLDPAHAQHAHGHHAHHHEGFGLETWAFTARRPFRERDLMKMLRRDLHGVVRAKGFYWTKEAYDRVGLLSLAGNVIRADRIGKWFITLRNEGEVREDDMPASIRAVWDDRLGDRRQELVFIGVDLDRESLQARLESCLADTA